MSLDRSLKGKSGLERHRNVLRRGERVVMLEENEKWAEGKNSVFGMIKVAHRKQVAAKKAPKVDAAVEGAVAGVPGAAPAAGAPVAAAAPGAKAPAGKAAAAPAAKAPAKK
jgi:small basic protein (TIGR04137 family)